MLNLVNRLFLCAQPLAQQQDNAACPRHCSLAVTRPLGKTLLKSRAHKGGMGCSGVTAWSLRVCKLSVSARDACPPAAHPWLRGDAVVPQGMAGLCSCHAQPDARAQPWRGPLGRAALLAMCISSFFFLMALVLMAGSQYGLGYMCLTSPSQRPP